MRISRVVPSFDCGAIASRYQVFRLRSSKGRIGYADESLDRVASATPVASVVFHGGGEAWVMTRREGIGPTGSSAVRSALAGRNDLAFAEAKRLDAIDSRTLLQLCLSAVAGAGCMDGASNVCGRLVVVSLGKPNTEYFRGTADPSCIHALEVGVSPRMELELRVRTFTSCAARRFKRDLPRFELVDGRYLRRALSYDEPDDKTLFCQGAPWAGDRYGGFAFMDASDADSFSRSKLGVLRSVLACLDELFGGAVQMGFEEAEDKSRVDSPASRLADRLALVARCFGERTVCVCDMTGELESQADAVADMVGNLYGVDAVVVDAPRVDAANLLLVQCRDHYPDAGADPYAALPSVAVVQHMTPASGFTRTATAVAVKELALKADVLMGRMSLFEWRWGEWGFAIKYAIDGGDGFAFVDVRPDGSMAFEGPISAIGTSAAHADLVEALLLNGECECAVRGPGGDVNVIGRTELFGVPNFEAVWHDLIEGRRDRRTRADGKPLSHAIGRGRADRELYFADAVDIASCSASDGRRYYRVGLRGYGMQYSATHKASVLREVIAIDGSRSLAEDLLPMLDVCLVRWGQPTVVPFPLKYLREWVAMEVTKMTS